jgi:nitroreductase
MPDLAHAIQAALSERFGEDIAVNPALPGLDELRRITAHRVHRRYLDREVAPELLRLLCACALSAPSKSDLQQADILIVREKAHRDAIADLLPEMPWLRQAPVFLMFLANGRRVPALAQWRGRPFPNDHLDLFFNAVVDASLVLATFLRAAEAVGLGCCPISGIRDHAAVVSDMLALPPKVVPIATAVACHHAARRALRGRRHRAADRNLRPPARADAPLSSAARSGALWHGRFLWLVGGQGAAIRGAVARGFQRLRPCQGLLPGLTPNDGARLSYVARGNRHAVPPHAVFVDLDAEAGAVDAVGMAALAADRL